MNGVHQIQEGRYICPLGRIHSPRFELGAVAGDNMEGEDVVKRGCGKGK